MEGNDMARVEVKACDVCHRPDLDGALGVETYTVNFPDGTLTAELCSDDAEGITHLRDHLGGEFFTRTGRARKRGQVDVQKDVESIPGA